MEDARLKIGVIGAGAVGAASLVSLVCRGDAGEIIVVNRDRKRARAVATDLQYGAALVPSVDIRDGDDQDLSGAAVVMITAGVNEKTGGATDRNDPAGRLRLLEANVGIYREILPGIAAAAPGAVILVLTDPPDPLADFTRTFGFKYVLNRTGGPARRASGGSDWFVQRHIRRDIVDAEHGRADRRRANPRAIDVR
jgi:L-lactate dehydrogenase